ncbi:MAG TPA: hypothetical protein VMV42_00815 [archaeon]|nr:hypothetical protein [archaeon]
MIIRIAGLLLGLSSVSCLLAVAADQQKSISERVAEELARGQLYDGEMFDRLVALGPEALPELCKQLDSYAFPVEIMNVLAEWQDPSVTPALLDFIATQESRRTTGMDAAYVIDAARVLREIGDPRAERVLDSIAANQANSIQLRFEANAALARLGSPTVKARASEEIMQMYRTKEGVADMAWPNPDVVLSEVFYQGLCDVQSKEAEQAVAEFLTAPGEGYQKQPVVKILGRREETRNRPKILEVLLHVAEHEQEYAEVDRTAKLTKLEALTALYRLKGVVPAERLQKIADEMLKDEDCNAWAQSDEPYWRKKAERLHRIKVDLDAELKREQQAPAPTAAVAAQLEPRAQKSGATFREPGPHVPEMPATAQKSTAAGGNIREKETMGTKVWTVIGSFAAIALIAAGLTLYQRKMRK